MSRAAFFVGVGGAALGAGLAAGRRWWTRQNALVEADRFAKSERDLFDRGLVGVERSGWTQPHGVRPPYASLEGSLTTEVLIVGAGLAGSSLALHLAETGVSVVVLEARQPGWGASGRNAGHVLPTLRTRSAFDHFPDKGKRFFEAFAMHRGFSFKLAERLGVACDAVQAGYLTVGARKGEITRLRKQTGWMEAAGMLAAEEIGGAELHRETGSTFWDHALLFPEGGRINPYLFTNGMIEAAGRLGALVFGDSPALSIARHGSRWTVRTAAGDVTADKVVFCTAAYPDGIVPAFTKAFYPLVAYALTTKPLPPEARSVVLPTRRTLAQAIDLNPMVRDHMDRLILSLIPSVSKPEDGPRHFRHHLGWMHRVWPETRGMQIELEHYWTGRVALRDVEFPGTFELEPGLYGLMYFNAWGNLMAPLLGKLFAEGLGSGRADSFPFPLVRPEPVAHINKQERLIRHLMIPAARKAQRLRII